MAVARRKRAEEKKVVARVKKPTLEGAKTRRPALSGISALVRQLRKGEMIKGARDRKRISEALASVESEYRRLDRVFGRLRNQTTVDRSLSPIRITRKTPRESTSEHAAEREHLPFVSTSPEVVDVMLKLANVGMDDVVYELGCGDGRIAIAAARDCGANAVGIDIDPDRIAEAKRAAKDAGVARLVKFKKGNLFDTDLRDATVVMMYLIPSYNAELRPKLLKELKPGARVVSHAFDMGDWNPLRRVELDGKPVFLWKISDDPSRRRGEH